MTDFQRLLVVRRLATALLCIAVLLSTTCSLQAQQQTISGKITSAKDGTPMPGVTIQVAGTGQGVSTNTDGSFTIRANAGSKLVISYIGYLDKEITVSGANAGIIKLEEDSKALNSVVVVGYGTQKKVNLTGAITTLNMADKEGQPITNVSNALKGMPGLYVNLGNSQPGVDRSTIRIRGVGTLNENDPLVLVDGIEYSMDELNPNDIESITVLKDASAAIYGSRAANGVILVTTKTGKGASRVNYSYYNGLQKATYLPDAIWDPIAYMKLKNQAVKNGGKQTPDYSDAEIAEYEAGMAGDPITYPSNNWFDIALGNGTIQKHDLNISGSSDKGQYRLSLGYLDRDGILFGPGNHENKYSLGLNTSFNVNSKLKVGLTLDGYYRNYTEPLYNSIWQYLFRTLPILTDQLADGRYGNSWLRTPGRNNWEHPRMLSFNGLSNKKIQRFLSTVFAEYKLPFDIKYNIKFGVDKYDGLLDQFTPRMQTFNPKTLAATNWNSPTTAPRSAKTDYNDMNIHFYNTLNWQHKFKELHNLSVMVGASYDNFSTDTYSATMVGYLDGTLTALDAGTIRNAIGGHDTKDVLESYFGRLNYDYDGKYLFEVSFRNDGSSRFADGRRWGFYPAASAGWRIDRESFFQSKFIDLLKLRVSAGKLGNQAVPLYSYEPSVLLSQDYSYNKVLSSGAAVIGYADPTISWESTTTYDVGTDLALWNNRINLTLDWYKKRTNGILRQVNLPAQVGNLNGPQKNVGSVDNSGIEVTLGYHDKIGQVDYEVNGNIAYNKNSVVDLGGQILYNDGTNLSTITKAGTQMNAYYLLEADGIFQSDAEVAASAFQSNATKAGYIKYKDQDKNNIINGDDRIVVKNSSIMPKYTFGFGFNVGYKGFSLSGFFQGVAGIKIYPTANLAFPFNNGANATWEWATDAWTPDNPNARLPIVTESTGNQDNFQSSTFWLRDGSYLRMKNIQLSYAVPAKWLSKVKINRVNVFVNAENWLTFTKYKDFDIESVVNASTLYHYPMLKTLSGGVNVTF
ncbi:SusC/RagA family TonB-linked outer membrane protein [Niastella yeongjuensis]|uniref:SusC/RagA family TonB-linked outer membrane protein n=1 Tax=Niastella yeongjuensis TaxID=354355 RepID=A0A1V9F552_9BACT|nr:TonB-dependent receptor [Niastella yeongjuensis]OQP53421.1 SusC/RagA family TonB-linked outer membrane protein [Niastella yeongjuensis]SEP12744.1 TonB-linked outer membrane protein, SusC/RagA family [Niastella yeongjuensis]